MITKVGGKGNLTVESTGSIHSKTEIYHTILCRIDMVYLHDQNVIIHYVHMYLAYVNITFHILIQSLKHPSVLDKMSHTTAALICHRL